MTNLTIPMPTQVIIDDVGWWRGTDDGATGGPYRTGIARNHVPADYTAIVELGRRLGMRPMAATILCEWDRDNILRDIPDSQWMGTAWNHSELGTRNSELDDAAAIVADNPDHIEIALHGVGHEFWGDGTMTRAEWFDMERNMRPRESVLRHIEFYGKLMERSGLGAFPESFVPAAFLYRFGMGEDGFAAILRRSGILFASTPFYYMFTDRQTESEFLGVDAGLLTVDRGRDLTRWDSIDTVPDGELNGPVCGMHWPTILHPDPSRNMEVVDRWVKFLQKQADKPDRMLSKNTSEAFSQLAYREFIGISTNVDRITFDFARVDSLGAVGLAREFHVKAPASASMEAVGLELRCEPAEGKSACSGDTRLWRITRLAAASGASVAVDNKAPVSG